jgi:hypothetical protein
LTRPITDGSSLSSQRHRGGPIGFKAPFYQCIAVSKTDDATGSYWLYSFDMTLGQGQLASTPCANAPCAFLNDYPKLGIRPDAYYMTFNEYDATTASSPFQGALVCAMQSSVMVSGGPNPAVVCKLLPTEDSLLPADGIRPSSLLCLPPPEPWKRLWEPSRPITSAPAVSTS